MKFNDSIKDGSIEEKDDENYFDGIEHSSFTKRQFGFKFSDVMGMPVLLSMTGVIVFVVLVSLIVMKTGESFDSENLKAMDTRLKQMEDRFIDLGILEKKLAGLAGQGDKIDKMVKRINTLESNLSARMERISKQLQTPKKQIIKGGRKSGVVNQKKVLKGKQSSSAKKSVVYHHVRSGDTLYNISRRYKLSLKELKQLNPSLSGKKSIYPGQKLRIKKRR
jgi:LysM repeat protein